MMSMNDREVRNKQMINMDVEAFARIEAATKIADVKKKKGYDDIVISESKSLSSGKKKDNDDIRDDKKSQQFEGKTEPPIMLEVNKNDSDQSAKRIPNALELQYNVNGQLRKLSPSLFTSEQRIATPPPISSDVRAKDIRKCVKSMKKSKKRKRCCGCCCST
ncbi:DNA translocase FtsK [Dirofilaria immitis]